MAKKKDKKDKDTKDSLRPPEKIDRHIRGDNESSSGVSQGDDKNDDKGKDNQDIPEVE